MRKRESKTNKQTEGERESEAKTERERKKQARRQGEPPLEAFWFSELISGHTASSTWWPTVVLASTVSACKTYRNVLASTVWPQLQTRRCEGRS